MKRSLMVVYSHYPSDTRLRKEANALIEAGYEVDVICLKDENQSSFEIFENVKIYRLNIKKRRGTLFNYLFLYLLFFIASFFKVTVLYFKRRYSIIHVHNMPNFIVYVALIPKLFGAKVIFDLHDPSPEIFLSISNKSQDSLLFKLAVIEEKISIWFADKIITTNIAFRDLFISRGCNEKKIKIVMNSPQTNIFNKVDLSKTLDKNNEIKKFRIMYNGTIIYRHGLDILIDAVYLLKEKIPNIELNIYGDGEFLTEIIQKIELLNLNDLVKYRGTFLVDKIAEEIPTMDLGVIPNRFDVFTNLNFPIRIFEFIYFKKPIIVPKTKGISDYFNDDSIFYFQPENTQNLANAIFSNYSKSADSKTIIEKAYNIYLKNTWEIQSKTLLQIYKELTPN